MQPLTSAQVCALLGKAVVRVDSRRVDVVRPATTPSVTAPLGWVLSDASEQAMRRAMAAQAAARCGFPGADVGSCNDGYGSMWDVLKVLGLTS